MNVTIMKSMKEKKKYLPTFSVRFVNRVNVKNVNANHTLAIVIKNFNFLRISK